MKEIVYKILIIAAIGVMYFLHFSSQQQVAFVDTIKLLDKYEGMIDAKKKIEQQNGVLRSNIDTLAYELECQIKKYEKDRITMTPNEVKLAEELLHSKQQQFMQYRDASTNKQKEVENKITKEVIIKLNEYIKLFGQKNNFQIIVGGNASGTVLYVNNKIDITDKIIEGLNNEY